MGDDDEGGSSKTVLIIFVVLFILLLLLVGIGAVVYFVVLDDDGTDESVTSKILEGQKGERGLGGVDLGPGKGGKDTGGVGGVGGSDVGGIGSGVGAGDTKNPNEQKGGPSLKPPTNVEVIFKKLNFTDANGECAKSDSRGYLMFPKSVEQEEEMMSTFIAKIGASSGKKELEDCGNEYFIGVRKAVDKEYVTSSGAVLPGSSIAGHDLYDEQHDFPSEHCMSLLEKSNYTFNNVHCMSSAFQCILCQYKCDTAQPYCYKIYKDTTITSYFVALEYCKQANPPGILAEVPHKSVLDVIREQLKTQKGVCSNPAIGHVLTKKYESVNEEVMPYQTERIYYRSGGGKHISMNCITINTAENFMWEVEACDKERCFVCLT